MKFLIGIIFDKILLMERRDFIKNLFAGTLFLWVSGIFYLLYSYLSFARKGKELFPRAKLNAKNLSLAKPALVKLGDEHIWVIETNENIFSAVSAICTHKRCIIEWDKEKRRFICPCHKGLFDKDGNPIFGPPTKPLKRFNVMKKGEEIIVSI